MGVGEAWKKRRDEMGKTIEDVSSELRISKKYLSGIEEGDYSRFPAKVFSIGFIRAYAAFLSVDPEPLLSEYLELCERGAKEEPPFHGKPEWLERERQRGSRRTAYAIAAAAALVIGIFLSWYGKHTALRPPPVPEIRQTSQHPPAPVPASAENTALPSDNAAVGGRETAAAPPASSPSVVVSPGGSGPVSAPYQLFLEASEMTWIMYSRDGSEPVDVMLYPGDRLSIQAQERIYLKIGNAGGVIGTLNGNVLPSFGEKGQVKELTLGE